jgi:flagellar hook-associated protein 2
MGISLNPSSILSGQGIDVSSLVEQAMSESNGQLTGWQNELTTLESQASDLTSINSDLTGLQNAVNALADPLGALTAQSATSSDPDVLTATADSSAVTGNHTIVVSNLATAGEIYTADVAGGADASFLPTGSTGGDLQLQIGGSSGQTEDIPITPGVNDTLNTLASYINTQSTQNGWGVTATVVTDANGARLAISSSTTGTAGALAITSNSTNLTFEAPVGGTNANVTVDGIPISSATNSFSVATIPGVTLNLASASPDETVDLTIGPDTSQATTAINNFVSAYNQVINDINTEFNAGGTESSQGPLGSDTALRDLETSLMNDVTYAVSGSGGMVNLGSFGINMNDDGTLTVGNAPNGESLSQILSTNPSSVLGFFQNSTSTGFANNFQNDLNNLTDPTTGVLSVDLTQNQAAQQDLQTTITNFQTQLSAQQTALTQEFDQVNATLQQYPLLLQQVTETLATLDSGGNTSTTTTTPTLTAGL